MIQIISNLGGSSQISATTIVRPVFVSLAFGVAVPIIGRFVVLPLRTRLGDAIPINNKAFTDNVATTQQQAFLAHTCILLAFTTAASYAGTSNLFSAYLAGASISWWDSTNSSYQSTSLRVPPAENSDSPLGAGPDVGREERQPQTQASVARDQTGDGTKTSGKSIFEHYFSVVLEKILKPCFFVSLQIH